MFSKKSNFGECTGKVIEITVITINLFNKKTILSHNILKFLSAHIFLKEEK